MKKIIVIVVLILLLEALGYIVFTNLRSDTIDPVSAQDIARDFINENLLQPGVTAEVGEVIEENGLYKMLISLPDGSSVNSYISKDGQLFFPEAMNIAEVKEQIANSLENNNINNENSMELKTEILSEGTGDVIVKAGDSVTVDYTGVLEDGTQFDSSIGRAPFSFNVGAGQVIQGWDQGLIGMNVGEERKLTIPSDMAYGPSGAGSIPPNATLIFTIKLISIE
jgi:hypothetical protein